MTAKGVSIEGCEVEPSDVIDTKNPSNPSPNPTKIAMPALADLSDITLHSPSSQIVGTPFATDSTKFEYPFPEVPPSPASTSPRKYSAVISPSANTLSMSIIAGNPQSPPPESCSSFPMLSTSDLSPSNTSPTESSMNQNSLGLSYSPISPSEMPSYNPAHPKLRTTNPPIPPSLAKKRKRWSLGLGSLGRRMSSSSTTIGSPGSDFASSPLGSPQERSTKH